MTHHAHRRLHAAATLAVIVCALAAAAALAQDGAGGRTAEPDTDAGDDSQWLEGIGENELVLVHGLGASARIWDRVLPFLKNNFQLHVYELHGHGQTPPLERPSLDAEVAALRAWIQDKGLIYPAIVGHGLGGMIAMQYTFAHPVDVQRLIVIDAAPRQLATAEQKRDIARALVEDYDRFVASRYVAISRDEGICDLAVDMALRTDSATFTALLLDSFDWDLSEELPRQAVPMLVVGSEAFLPDAGYERAYLAEYGFGEARSLAFKRVEGTGHYLMLEKPTFLGSVITVWLREGE
jgi:pimeloyl-ACP methyl ester carboxylesterase